MTRKNTPTFDELAFEYRTALEVAVDLEKHAKSLRELASNMFPDRGRIFAEREDKEQARARFSAEMDIWGREYNTPAEKQTAKATAARLYSKAIGELLRDRVRAHVYANIFAPGFIDKYEGTPARYKRVQKAIFAGLPDSVSLYVTDGNYCAGWFAPYHDNPERAYTARLRIDEFSLPGLKWLSYQEYEFSRERLEANRPHYTGRETWPTFAEVHAACNKAPKIKARGEKILADANKKFYDLLEANNAGISCINEAMKR